MTPKQYRVWASTCAAQLFISGWALAQTPEPVALDSTDMAYPVVITPTRLRQSLADVPASVTIITADTLRRYGITSIPDALRLVPGMAITQATGNDFRITYHGTEALHPRRMNVLVDGVSAYMPALSRVEWVLLPVAFEDIDRIEVTRGPDSSAYGPNSMMAVINILTKHAKDVERGLVSVSAGTRGESQVTARVATSVGPTDVRLTAQTLYDGGYDQISLMGGGHDALRTKRLSLRAQTDLSDGSALDVQASYVGGLREVPLAFDFQRSHPDQHWDSTQVSARWMKSLSSTHEVQLDFYRADSRVKQRWTSCYAALAFWPEVGELYAANPSYVAQFLARQIPPTGGSPRDDVLAGVVMAKVLSSGASAFTPTCGKVNEDMQEARTQVELQDTYVVSDALRVVSGLGLRYQRGVSESFFGRAVGNNVRWVFGHAEYRPTDFLTANLGGYYEANSLSGSTFSPRLALNAHLSSEQTLRAVFSKGTRTPDIYEERAVWSYTLRDLSPPVSGATTARLPFEARAKGNLGSEHITSAELGYMLSLRKLGLMLDARVFDDRLSRLISEDFDVTQTDPSNSGAVRLSGAELQAQWDFAPRWSGFVNYSRLISRQASGPAETMQYSKHSGSVGVSHELSDDWRVSVAHYGASGDGYHERRYARTDMAWSYAFRWGGMLSLATLNLSYLDTPVSSIYRRTTGPYTASHDERWGVSGGLRIAF